MHNLVTSGYFEFNIHTEHYYQDLKKILNLHLNLSIRFVAMA